MHHMDMDHGGGHGGGHEGHGGMEMCNMNVRFTTLFTLVSSKKNYWRIVLRYSIAFCSMLTLFPILADVVHLGYHEFVHCMCLPLLQPAARIPISRVSQ